MTKLQRAAVIAVLTCLAAALPALALWDQFENDKPVEADGWPKPFVKALNASKRVYGAGSFDVGWTFYFKGQTADVNAFLSQLAEEKGAALDVVLNPEAGSAKPNLLEQELKIDYEWSLHIYPYRRNALFSIHPNSGESDAEYVKRRAQQLDNVPEFGAVVTVHCVGAIAPEALKIPLRFKASMGGRLANFAELHNRRRVELEKQRKTVDAEPPTDMQATEMPQARFGSPSTKPVERDGG